MEEPSPIALRPCPDVEPGPGEVLSSSFATVRVREQPESNTSPPNSGITTRRSIRLQSTSITGALWIDLRFRIADNGPRANLAILYSISRVYLSINN